METFYRGQIRLRYLVTLLMLALLAVATYGAQKLVFKSDYRVFFG